MNITLFRNDSELNKIGKNITEIATLEGSIKEPSSIINPVITISYSNPINFNYCYIDSFDRYYFVRNVDVVHNNILKITLHVDVLESFKTQILNQSIIMDKSTSNFDNYLPDENRVINTKTKTDILNFPNGLLESGEFILITAGG